MEYQKQYKQTDFTTEKGALKLKEMLEDVWFGTDAEFSVVRESEKYDLEKYYLQRPEAIYGFNYVIVSNLKNGLTPSGKQPFSWGKNVR